MAHFRTLTINLSNLMVMDGKFDGVNLVTIVSHNNNDYIEIIGNYNNKNIHITSLNRVKAYFISSKPDNLLSSLNIFVENLDEDDKDRLRSVLPKLNPNDNIYQQIADFFGVGLALYTLIVSGYIINMKIFDNIQYFLKHLYAKDVIQMVSLVLCCYVSCYFHSAEYLIVAKAIEFINVFVDGFDICIINDYNKTQLTIATIKCLLTECTYPYKCKMDDVCNEYSELSNTTCSLRNEIKHLRCELQQLTKEFDCLKLKLKCKELRPYCNVKNKVKHNAGLTDLAHMNNPNENMTMQEITKCYDNDTIIICSSSPIKSSISPSSEYTTITSSSSSVSSSDLERCKYMNRLKRPKKSSVLRKSLSVSELDYYDKVNNLTITEIETEIAKYHSPESSMTADSGFFNC